MIDDEKAKMLSKVFASFSADRLAKFEEIDLSLNDFSPASFSTLIHSLLETGSKSSSAYRQAHARA